MPVALTPLRHTARRIRPKALLDGFANALWRKNDLFSRILIEHENQKPYTVTQQEMLRKRRAILNEDFFRALHDLFHQFGFFHRS